MTTNTLTGKDNTMTKQEIASEALSRATQGQSIANYATIFEGFQAKGIAENDIIPRVNVLTYHAWKAVNRQVKKGEHGVKVFTFIVMTKTVKDGDTDKTETFKRPKSTTVFHISQTDEIV